MTATQTANLTDRLLDRDFAVSTFRYNRWSADLSESQTLEQALEPSFWSGQAEKIMGHDKANPRGRGDIIEVRKADTGEYAELLVTEAGAGFVKVEMIARCQPQAAELPEKAPFTTRWNVGSKKHDVIRKKDKQVMAQGFQTKDAAHRWIAEHLKAMAA